MILHSAHTYIYASSQTHSIRPNLANGVNATPKCILGKKLEMTRIVSVKVIAYTTDDTMCLTRIIVNFRTNAGQRYHNTIRIAVEQSVMYNKLRSKFRRKTKCLPKTRLSHPCQPNRSAAHRGRVVHKKQQGKGKPGPHEAPPAVFLEKKTTLVGPAL